MTALERYALHRLSPDVLAFVHPAGSWGINNTGLICDREARALLVDTLFTVELTRQMIDIMAAEAPAAKCVETVLNTHANGDHCWGNALFEDREIIATASALEEMKSVTPALMDKLMTVARVGKALGAPGRGLGALLSGLGAETLGAVLRASAYLIDIFGRFDFSGIEAVFPTRLFTGELSLSFGEREIRLIELGPAHTGGDCVVFLPKDRILFAGDLLFNGSHPLLWEGPASNWIAACDTMLALEPEQVVPGHGPLTDATGIRRQRDYFVALVAESRRLFDAEIPISEAADRCDLGPVDPPAERERLAVNIETMYREFRGEGRRRSIVPCFPLLAAQKRHNFVR